MGAAYAVSQYAKCLAEGIGVEQNPKEAARLFEMCASREEIDTWAAIQLASFYLRGFGVEKDEGKAKEWLDKLEKIADRSEGLRGIGTLLLLCEFYIDGEKGVGKDADRAFKMARRAEKIGEWWGYKFMARCYKDGIGVEKNIAKAKEYVEKALKACKCKEGRCDNGELKKLQKELESMK